MKQQRNLTLKEKSEKVAVDNQDVIIAIATTVVGTIVGNAATSLFNLGKSKVSELMEEKGFGKTEKPKKKKTSEKLNIEGGEE